MTHGVAAAAGIDLATLRDLGADVWAVFWAWVVDGFAHTPVLMAGLALVVVMPPLAIAGYIAARLTAPRQRPAPDPMKTQVAMARGLGLPQDAWIVIEGPAPLRRAVPREMLSLGREDDNDICLDDATVHRHHAVLHRTADAHVMIRDLSGSGGNGVRVNGERVRETALADGDRIEIGAVKITYEARPV
jgi:hypothetical protein